MKARSCTTLALTLLFFQASSAQTPSATSAALLGHRGAVTAIAFAPDQRTFVTAGVDGTVRVWNVAATVPARTLAKHNSEVFTAAYSPSGALIASSSYDGVVLVHRSASGKRVATFQLGSWSTALAFLDESHIVVGDQSKTLHVVDANTGQSLKQCKVDAPINALAVTQNGNVVLGGPLGVWDPYSCVRVRSIKAPGGVTAVAASSGGAFTTSAHMRGVVFRWDSLGRAVDSTKVEREASIASARGTVRDTVRVAVTAVALDLRGEVMVYGDARAGLWVYYPDTKREPLLLPGHVGSISAVAIDRNGSVLVSGATDGTLRVWHISR